METMTFKVSAEAIRQNKQRYLVLQLAAPFLLALDVLIVPMQNRTLGFRAFVFGLMVAVVELTLFIRWTSLYRKIRGSRVSLTKDTIEYTNRKFTASINYAVSSVIFSPE